MGMEIFSHPGWQHWLWTLGHSLWQGSLLFLILSLLMKALPVAKSRLRYFTAIVAMMLFVFTAAATWSFLGAESNKTEQQATIVPHPTSTISASPMPTVSTPISSTPARTAAAPSTPFSWQVWLTAGWCIGVVLMLLRCLVSLSNARRHVLRAQPVVQQEISSLFSETARKLGMRGAVILKASTETCSPYVYGILRPCVVIPANMLTAAPMPLLEAIFTHELAHIRRSDFVLNLFQLIIEAVFFFNPFVWLISRQIRVEREACCDAIAAQLTGPDVMATAIAHSLDLSLQSAVSPALVGTGSQPADRVSRLLFPRRRPATMLSAGRLFLTISGIICLNMMLCFAGSKTGKTVSRLLTPEEKRIVEAVKREAEFGTDSNWEADFEPKKMITIKGRIRLQNTPLPKEIPEHLKAEHRGSKGTNFAQAINAGTMFRMRPDTRNAKNFMDHYKHWKCLIGNDGTFSANVYPGNWELSVEAPGYQKFEVTDLNAVFTKDSGLLDVVLLPKASCTITLRTPEGAPIRNAHVSCGVELRTSASSWIGKHLGDYKTDVNGNIEIASVEPDAKLLLKVNAEGFQFLGTSTPVKSKIELTLQPAVRFTGTIRRPDGSTVDDCQVLVWKTGHWCSGVSSDNRSKSELHAVSNETGSFSYTILPEQALLDIACYKPEVGFRYLSGLRRDTLPTTITLDPLFTIKGLLTGKHWRKESAVAHNYLQWKYANSKGNGRKIFTPFNRKTDIKVNAETGEFTISNLIAEKINFFVGDTIVHTHKPTGNKDPVVINLDSYWPELDKRDAPAKLRQVELNFVPPANHPLPNGMVQVYAMESDNSYDLKVIQGKATAMLPVGSGIGVLRNGLDGYFQPTTWCAAGMPKVKDGNGTQTIRFDIFPAGALTINLYHADGRPATFSSWQLSVASFELPPAIRNAFRGMSASTSKNEILGDKIPVGNSRHISASGHKLLVNKLPLGGTYQFLLVQSGDDGLMVLQTPEFSVTAETPFPEVNVVIPEGKDVTVRLIRPDGSSIDSCLSFQLTTSIAPCVSYNRELASRYKSGKVELKNVNSSVPVSLRVGSKEHTITFDRDTISITVPDADLNRKAK